jgi:hypothetical protein
MEHASSTLKARQNEKTLFLRGNKVFSFWENPGGLSESTETAST